jgi:integrase
MILLGFASALRRSELVALTLADVEVRPAASC